MGKPKTIPVHEYGCLQVNETYNSHEFTQSHFDILAKYLTIHPSCQFYSLLHKRVKFCNYVGVIKVGDITIEVLPKTDKHQETEEVWQSVLINMLAISLQVEARTTTNADIQIKQHSVLETYLHLFLDEVKAIVHHGLVKKYRKDISNQTSLKGKLLIHQHVSKNLVHAERFYVSHTVYDRNNVYNYILQETLRCIKALNVSEGLDHAALSLLIDFPDCKPVRITEKLFERLTFDRKTERYRTAIQLARIILMNYHPDIKGGRNNVLAIMFDMNHLWENYVYWLLRKVSYDSEYLVVKSQQRALFWRHPDEWSLRLKPDLIVEIKKDGTTKAFILDTKWKYKSDTSIQDVRQMYAYLNYFPSDKAFLVYPDRLAPKKVVLREGNFYNSAGQPTENGCGLAFVDLLDGGRLSKDVGQNIVNHLIGNIVTSP